MRIRTNSRFKAALGGVLVAFALLAAACGGDDTDTAAGENGDSAEVGNGDEFSFGEPADADDADRVIEIEADDDFTFDPDVIEVEVGETVTFEVTNIGDLEHDFTLGDEATQEAHAEEMADMDGDMADMDHGDVNAMTLPAGETHELTWKFTEPGDLIIGCHTTGHYESGMHSEVTVKDA